MAASAHDVEKQVKMYLVVLISLAVLTGLTVWVSSWELAVIPAVALAMVIASIKGSLVASVFMHLLHERKAVFIMLLITLIFFVALLFLPVVTSSHDYAYGIVPMEPVDHFKNGPPGHHGEHGADGKHESGAHEGEKGEDTHSDAGHAESHDAEH